MRPERSRKGRNLSVAGAACPGMRQGSAPKLPKTVIAVSRPQARDVAIDAQMRNDKVNRSTFCRIPLPHHSVETIVGQTESLSVVVKDGAAARHKLDGKCETLDIEYRLKGIRTPHD